MREMKDSGIDWIGEIPAHWGIKRFKSFAKTIKGKSYELLPEYIEGSYKVLSVECLRQDEAQFYDYTFADDEKQICSSNDIVVIWDGAGVGEFLRAKDGVLSSTIAKIQPTSKDVKLPFLWHWRYKIEYILKQMPTGMGIPHLNPNILNNYNIAVPPIEEQQAIADYLDEKTAEIDKQISLHERQQKAYEKLKRSLISQVVTRGLNKDVPLKDSGIDWIGEIPAHWEIHPLRLFITLITPEKKEDKEFQLLSVTRDKGVIVRGERGEDGNNNRIPDDLSNYKVVRKNQFVINKMKAWMGSYGVSNYEGIVSPAYYICDVHNIYEPFLSLAIRCKLYTNFFWKYSKGIRVDQWDMSPLALKEIPFVTPPIEEQQEIVAYLEKKTAEIDRKISLIGKKIETYKRLKQSLIDEVVTGKRKI